MITPSSRCKLIESYFRQGFVAILWERLPQRVWSKVRLLWPLHQWKSFASRQLPSFPSNLCSVHKMRRSIWRWWRDVFARWRHLASTLWTRPIWRGCDHRQLDVQWNQRAFYRWRDRSDQQQCNERNASKSFVITPIFRHTIATETFHLLLLNYFQHISMKFFVYFWLRACLFLSSKFQMCKIL